MYFKLTEEQCKEIQLLNEYSYSKKHINRYLKEDITKNYTSTIHKGIDLLKKYVSTQYYESKDRRIQEIKNKNLEDIVVDTLVIVAYLKYKEPELFSATAGRLAKKLDLHENHKDNLTTSAEILAVLAELDMYDVTKKEGVLYITNNIVLDNKLVHYISNSCYLLPLVSKPMEVSRNFHSPYYTHNESLILGGENHHDDPISLDVVNTQNNVLMKLDKDFLLSVEEIPNKPLEVKDQQVWDEFVKQSKYIYLKLINQTGGYFYLGNRYDKRGRLYASGYHINPQGAPYKKAMIEFAEEVMIPIEYSEE